MEGMHDADDVVFCCCFGLDDIAVSKEGDSVLVNFDDAVDEVVASVVAD